MVLMKIAQWTGIGYFPSAKADSDQHSGILIDILIRSFKKYFKNKLIRN